jgi:photosystem II stability/assembly factor-like uncharacterized protein
MNIIYNLAFLLLFQFLFVFDRALEFPRSSPLLDSQHEQKRDKDGAVKIVFKSTDGGQTWQDISEGLPANLEEGGFFANESGLYLRAGNGIYHSKPNSTAPFWKKEIFLFPDKQGSIAPGKAGIFAYNFDGQFLQKIKGTSAWLPVYTNFQGKEVRTVFETAGGTVFIGSNNRLFKSTNSGKTWKALRTGGLVMKMVESNGVLLATGAEGILRSTDDGENWKWVIKEGGVGIAVEHIKGGFAAITYSSASNTRRVRTSYDGGKTWQPIDAGLPAQVFIVPVDKPLSQVNPNDSIWHPINTGLPVQAFITSIIQVGEYFFCGHPTGIFRSSDKGKTWKLLLPSIEGKVFNLSVSGNVIYAIPVNGGC